MMPANAAVCFLLPFMVGCEKTAAPAAQPAPEPPKSIVKKDLPLPAPPYLTEIRAAAENYFGFPAPIPVFYAQIHAESNFKADARSPVGASGLMQIMPSTAKFIAAQAGFGIAAPNDPAFAIKAGIWYDRFLYDRVRVADSKCDRWLFTFSSYNGGLGWVQKRQALSKSPGSWSMTGNINPGITESNQRENFSYGPKIVYALQPKYVTLGPLVCKGGS